MQFSHHEVRDFSDHIIDAAVTRCYTKERTPGDPGKIYHIS